MNWFQYKSQLCTLYCRYLQSLLLWRQVSQYHPTAATLYMKFSLGLAHATFGKWVVGVHAPKVVGVADASKLWLVGTLTPGVLCPGDIAPWLPNPPQGQSAAI